MQARGGYCALQKENRDYSELQPRLTVSAFLLIIVFFSGIHSDSEPFLHHLGASAASQISSDFLLKNVILKRMG